MKVGPENTAARVALWRALHVQIDAPPHVFKDEVGLQLVARSDTAAAFHLASAPQACSTALASTAALHSSSAPQACSTTLASTAAGLAILGPQAASTSSSSGGLPLASQVAPAASLLSSTSVGSAFSVLQSALTCSSTGGLPLASLVASAAVGSAAQFAAQSSASVIERDELEGLGQVCALGQSSDQTAPSA